MPDVEASAIAEVKIVKLERHGDERGFFCEVYNEDRFARAGIAAHFVQDNHSYSASRGTIRGLHFQAPPFAQDKLIRVTRGRILDVVVDIRRGSPTFGRHVALELSAQNWLQLFVPKGFAHGFCTLEPDCEVVYKVSAGYAPQHDFGVAWDDPDLGIAWPVAPNEATLSGRDRRHPRLADLPAFFA